MALTRGSVKRQYQGGGGRLLMIGAKRSIQNLRPDQGLVVKHSRLLEKGDMLNTAQALMTGSGPPKRQGHLDMYDGPSSNPGGYPEVAVRSGLGRQTSPATGQGGGEGYAESNSLAKKSMPGSPLGAQRPARPPAASKWPAPLRTPNDLSEQQSSA